MPETRDHDTELRETGLGGGDTLDQIQDAVTSFYHLWEEQVMMARQMAYGISDKSYSWGDLEKGVKKVTGLSIRLSKDLAVAWLSMASAGVGGVPKPRATSPEGPAPAPSRSRTKGRG